MGTVKVEIDGEIPDGYQFLRYDYAKQGDKFIDEHGSVMTWNSRNGQRSYAKFFIVREEQQYREPSIPGEPCECMQEGIWKHRFYIGKTRNGSVVVENDSGELSWGYLGCRAEILKANEPEYRDVGPGDEGKEIEVRNHNKGPWTKDKLRYWPTDGLQYPTDTGFWLYARIKAEPVQPTYRDVTEADIGKEVEVRDNTGNAWNVRRLKSIRGRDFAYRFMAGSPGTGWRYARIKND